MESFDQLLIYRKTQVSRNNLQVYNARFSIFHFKLSSITIAGVITAKLLFLQCYSCTVNYWVCSQRGAVIYYKVSTRHNQLKTDYDQNSKIKIYHFKKRMVTQRIQLF